MKDSPLLSEIKNVINQAAKEDDIENDITTQACIEKDETIIGHIILKDDGCIAGLKFLPMIFHIFDPTLQVKVFFPEGALCTSQTILATITGKAHSILSLERSILNILQHLCGIATLTQKYVAKVKDLSCDILDTRKTIPSLRYLQKYAVKMGGGKNHRFSLSQHFLIKNNHLSILKKKFSHPLLEAIKKAKRHKNVKVEIEIDNLSMLKEALLTQPDIILLDNMDVDMVKKCVDLVNHQVYLEVSGKITLTNLRDYACTGVNGISIGALTHSSQALDISLQVQ